jgi:hypothetical protein
MRVFLTTVAGSATRFSESIGKPTVKCIYNREDPAKTLLNHMLTQASDYDLFVIVGGFLINELEDYINTNLPSEFSEKVMLVNNEQYAEYGSGWSLYLGLDAALKIYGNDITEVLFAEGDLFVDDESFSSVAGTKNSVITINSEAIKANKAVALYYDLENVPHYIYDTAHGQLKIDEPFTAVYNSGQIWKFTDIELLTDLVLNGDPERFTGTNLVLINEYFQKLAKNGETIDIISMKTWINCNTINDFIIAGL